ncbi:histone-lysine N-methyltransferase ATXR3 [Trifolium repens]|nr:histone-lysine N-methyltransferase ATXR3 [Trifolium repens]
MDAKTRDFKSDLKKWKTRANIGPSNKPHLPSLETLMPLSSVEKVTSPDRASRVDLSFSIIKLSSTKSLSSSLSSSSTRALLEACPSPSESMAKTS